MRETLVENRGIAREFVEGVDALVEIISRRFEWIGPRQCASNIRNVTQLGEAGVGTID